MSARRPRDVNNNTEFPNTLTFQTQALVFSTKNTKKKKKKAARLSEFLTTYFRRKLNFLISSRCSLFHHRAASL